MPDGAVLFLGSASCGKSALVSRVCADSDGPADEDMPKIPDITAYDSFVASDMDEVRLKYFYICKSSKSHTYIILTIRRYQMGFPRVELECGL